MRTNKRLISRVVCFITFLLFLATSETKAQAWVEKMQDRTTNFYDIQDAFNTEWGNKPYVRGNGWKQFKRWEAFWEPRVFPHGLRPSSDFIWKEHKTFERTYSQNGTARSANWTPMGPFSWTNSSYNPGMGRINVITEDPTDANIIYVGTPAGGCWKTIDGGGTWTPLTDHLQSLGVSAIAVDYVDNNVVYIGTGDDDGSDTYSIGMFKSIDGGGTWQEVTSSSAALFGSTIYKIIIHPTDHNTVFVASSTGCHKSIDGGASWTLLRSGVWRDMELNPADPNIMYVCNRSFYRSADGGLTWSPVSTGLPSSSAINRAEIAVSAANSDYVYFVCGKSGDASFYGLYRSTNSGQSFALQTNTPNIFSGDIQGSNLTSGQSWYDLAIAASPTNAEEIYVGGINVWKSTNGGTTFTIKSHWVYPPNVAYTHADIHALEVVGNRVYCGSDGGIFKSTNGGNQFIDLSDGLCIGQFYKIAGSEQVPQKIIGGTQDNGCNLLENGDALHTNGADGMEVLIDPNDSLVIYTSSQYGNFRRSNDGGYSSNGIFSGTPPGAWVTPLVMNPSYTAMLLIGLEEVYLSVNQGGSYSVISSFNDGELLRSLALSESSPMTHVYAATYDDIWGTRNGGVSWTNITNGLPSAAISSITVHPDDSLKVWVTFSGYFATNKVYMTEDGGTTWTNISGNLPNIPINCMAYQKGSHDGLYVGTDVGIYYTDTALAGWQQYMTGLPNVIVNDLEINYGIGKIRAGTFGRGIWEANIKAPLTTPPVANFEYSTDQICTTDSIAFTDISTDHAPSWTWHFPGGSPSTSTLRNPKVVFPASGIYNVTLVVQNLNGVDSVVKAIPISYEPNVLDFTVQLDNSSIEVAWKLEDTTGNVLYNSPLFALNGQDSQLIQFPFCLKEGCYTLTMIDVGGNGLCCGNGEGHYSVINSNGDTLAFGTSYSNTDVTTFCVNQEMPITVGTVAKDATCGVADGEIALTALGGDGTYLYSIDSGATFSSMDTFSNLMAGTYNIVIQDGSGAQESEVVIINSLGNPTAIASASASTVYLNQGGQTSFFSTNSTNAGTYLWTFPNGTTSSQADPLFTFGTGGTQDVVLAVSNGNCTDTDTLSITVVDNVSIDEIENSASLYVNPNPIQDRFTIGVDFIELQDNAEVIIHNALGQRVFWEEIENIKNYKRQLHFGNESNGVYILTVLTQKMAISKKFIKG